MFEHGRLILAPLTMHPGGLTDIYQVVVRTHSEQVPTLVPRYILLLLKFEISTIMALKRFSVIFTNASKRLDIRVRGVYIYI